MAENFKWIIPLIGETIWYGGHSVTIVGIHVDEHGSECVGLLKDTGVIKMVHFSKLPVAYALYKKYKSSVRHSNKPSPGIFGEHPFFKSPIQRPTVEDDPDAQRYCGKNRCDLD